MRIALVLEQFDARKGGLEQWTARFAEGLDERGHEVHAVTRRFVPHCTQAPVVLHRVEAGKTPVAFAEAAQAKLMELAPDVIHDMGCGWYCDVFHPHGGSWAAVTRRKQDMLPGWLRQVKRRVDKLLPRHRRFASLLAGQYADRGQLMIALSQTVAEDFQRFHGVPEERIRVIYNGVDVERFTPANQARWRASVRRHLGIGEDAVLALIVAHNFRLKGVPTLLRAMRRLRSGPRPVHLAVVGGKRFARWRLEATGLGVGRRVHFVGTADDTAPYYAAADLYVHPTIYDACSLVVLEAAASGLPVVTSRVNGVADLLTHGADSLLLERPTDVAGLSGAMRLLLDDARRAELAAAARRTALRHTLRRNVEEVLAVYDEVLAMRGSTARSAIAGNPATRRAAARNHADSSPRAQRPERAPATP